DDLVAATELEHLQAGQVDLMVDEEGPTIDVKPALADTEAQGPEGPGQIIEPAQRPALVAGFPGPALPQTHRRPAGTGNQKGTAGNAADSDQSQGAQQHGAIPRFSTGNIGL